MKLKDNLAMRKIGDEYIMVSESGSTLDYTRVISLNDSAAYLIQKVVGEPFSKEDLVSMIIEKYDIDKQTAETDVQKLLDKLLKAEFIVVLNYVK